MAYVRQRGKQVLIVHGVRDPETRAVEQRILCTLYTRDEALDALGRRERGTAESFRFLMEQRHPDLTFSWKAIRAAIARLLPVLPESAATGAPSTEFGDALAAFARVLVTAVGGESPEVTGEALWHRTSLKSLRELLDMAVAMEASEVAPVARPRWSFASRAQEVPMEIEELWSDAFDAVEDARAEAGFTLLTRAFAGYAEGHNYLGLLALRADRPDDAIAHFERTIEVARSRLPKRVGKDRWWSDHATRPYMRGLRNLALALNHAGQPTKALAVCDRLEQECRDLATAEAHRATAFLLLGRWAKALVAARFNHHLSPSESLLMAFAQYELGDIDEADACLLHASLNTPHTVAVVLGARHGAPSRGQEARDHNFGVTLQQTLRGYLVKKGAAARKHLAARFRCELFTSLRDELGAVERRWHECRSTEDRTDYHRVHEMQSPAFARKALGLSPEEGPATEGASTRARRPKPRAVGRVVH
jgi:tetratricopeptide (TPR) repeat protein